MELFWLRKPELYWDINLKHDLLVRNAGSRSLSSGSTMLINYSVRLSPLPPPSLLMSYYMLWPQFSLQNNPYSPYILSIDFPLTILSCLRLSSHLSQGYEDWLRHKADCSINECPVDVVQQGKVVRTQSHKLRVRMASLEQCST